MEIIMYSLKLQKVCREYEKLSDESRRQLLRETAEKIRPALESIIGDGEKEFILFVGAACGSDGFLSEEEYALFSDVAELSMGYYEAKCMAKAADTDLARAAVDDVVDFFGILDPATKAAMVAFCLCFCSADGKVTAKERKFISMLAK